MAIGASIKVGIEVIKDEFEKHQNYSGRIQKIDVQDALQDGIVGLAAGAIRGGYVGCTGGTVVFPGLGTATGCVGGAVLGGALGFIGGVGYSLLKQALFD